MKREGSFGNTELTIGPICNKRLGEKLTIITTREEKSVGQELASTW